MTKTNKHRRVFDRLKRLVRSDIDREIRARDAIVHFMVEEDFKFHNRKPRIATGVLCRKTECKLK